MILPLFRVHSATLLLSYIFQILLSLPAAGTQTFIMDAGGIKREPAVDDAMAEDNIEADVLPAVSKTSSRHCNNVPLQYGMTESEMM